MQLHKPSLTRVIGIGFLGVIIVLGVSFLLGLDLTAPGQWMPLIAGLGLFAWYAVLGTLYNGFATQQLTLRPFEGLIGGALAGFAVGALTTVLSAGLFVLQDGVVVVQRFFDEVGLQAPMTVALVALVLAASVVLAGAITGMGAAVAASLDEYSQSDPHYSIG